MTTKYYVSQDGKYVGAYVGAAVTPPEVIEVPLAPESADQIWNFETNQWGAIPIKVPNAVTMRQARLVLLSVGILDAVENALATMEGEHAAAARIEWNHSSEVHRDKPFVQLLAAQLGLNSEQLDQLFITASQID